MPPSTPHVPCLEPSHLDDSQPCKHATVECADHLRDISLLALREVDEQTFTRHLAHADRHRYGHTIVAIWVLMYYGHVMGKTPPDERRRYLDGSKWAALNTAFGDQPWVNLLRMLSFGMTHQDAENTVATLNAVLDHPDHALRFRVIRSLAASVATGLDHALTDGTVTMAELMLYHLYGMHTNHEPVRFAAVPLLVDMTAAIARGDHEVGGRCAGELTTWDAGRAVPALRLGISALAHTMDPSGVTVVMASGSTVTEHGPDNVTGILDWRDEALDPGRSEIELTSCRIIRMATAQARKDWQAVADVLLKVPEDDLQSFVLHGLITITTMLATALAIATTQAEDPESPG